MENRGTIDNKTRRSVLREIIAATDPPLRESGNIRVQNDVIALGHPTTPEQTIRLFLPTLVQSLFREYDRQCCIDPSILETALTQISLLVPDALHWPFNTPEEAAVAVADAVDACVGELQARLAEDAERRGLTDLNGTGCCSNPTSVGEALARRPGRSQPRAETRCRALLDAYRGRLQKLPPSTFQERYNAHTVTDVAIYEHLHIDRSRYYKFRLYSRIYG